MWASLKGFAFMKQTNKINFFFFLILGRMSTLVFPEKEVSVHKDPERLEKAV